MTRDSVSKFRGTIKDASWKFLKTRLNSPQQGRFPTTISKGSNLVNLMKIFVAGTLALMISTSASKAADIVDTAVAAGSFKTLVAAVKAADLVGTLKSPGPFTVFAPTDAAFKKLPKGTLANLLKPENKDKLVKILTYHVVPGKVMAADIVGKTIAVSTVEGDQVQVNGKHGVRVNDAHVVKADIVADNGVIHVIDKVLLPN